jgi:hypothetical protein
MLANPVSSAAAGAASAKIAAAIIADRTHSKPFIVAVSENKSGSTTHVDISQIHGLAR